jgi:hypothetical protein
MSSLKLFTWEGNFKSAYRINFKLPLLDYIFANVKKAKSFG